MFLRNIPQLRKNGPRNEIKLRYFNRARSRVVKLGTGSFGLDANELQFHYLAERARTLTFALSFLNTILNSRGHSKRFQILVSYHRFFLPLRVPMLYYRTVVTTLVRWSSLSFSSTVDPFITIHHPNMPVITFFFY